MNGDVFLIICIIVSFGMLLYTGFFIIVNYPDLAEVPKQYAYNGEVKAMGHKRGLWGDLPWQFPHYSLPDYSCSNSWKVTFRNTLIVIF